MYQGDTMVKIQLDLSESEDKIVDVYKIVNNLKTKQEAIKKMIQHFKVNIKPEKMEEKEYFK